MKIEKSTMTAYRKLCLANRQTPQKAGKQSNDEKAKEGDENFPLSKKICQILKLKSAANYVKFSIVSAYVKYKCILCNKWTVAHYRK